MWDAMGPENADCVMVNKLTVSASCYIDPCLFICLHDWPQVAMKLCLQPALAFLALYKQTCYSTCFVHCVMTVEIYPFSFLQWLDNCKRTFGANGDIDRINTNAHVSLCVLPAERPHRIL